MLKIADSSLENMINKVSKIRDLTFQAINSTYSQDKLSAIQTEIDELTKEIKREKDSVMFNQRKIFDPSVEKITETKPPEKPYAYEMEYLKSTGTQWINTGFSSQNGMVIKYKGRFDSYGYLVGSHSSSQPYGRNGGYLQSNNTWELGYGDTCERKNSQGSLGVDYEVEFSTLTNNAYLEVNGQRLITNSDT